MFIMRTFSVGKGESVPVLYLDNHTVLILSVFSNIGSASNICTIYGSSQRQFLSKSMKAHGYFSHRQMFASPWRYSSTETRYFRWDNNKLYTKLSLFSSSSHRENWKNFKAAFSDARLSWEFTWHSVPAGGRALVAQLESQSPREHRKGQVESDFFSMLSRPIIVTNFDLWGNKIGNESSPDTILSWPHEKSFGSLKVKKKEIERSNLW